MFENISGKLQKVFKKLKGRGRLTESNIEEALKEIRLALLEADVHYRVARDLISRVRERAVGQEVMGSLTPGQQVVKIVHDEMLAMMGAAENRINLSGKPSIVMVIGLQGAGKTTLCAKLARMIKKTGMDVSMVAADTRRPAAVSQLKLLGERAGIQVFEPGGENDPLRVIKRGIDEAKTAARDAVIIDTSGRLHVDAELMAELKKIKSMFKPEEIMLAVDAMTGQDAVKIAESFNSALGIDSVALTKLDGDARGGAALSVRAVCGKPIKFAGTGEKPDDLERFLPDRIVSRILGMGDVVTLVEKVESAVTEEQKQKWEKKFRGNSLTLEDLMEQFRMLDKMGSLESLAEALPGGAGISGKIDGSRIKKFEAIISSMTPEERRESEIIDGSRRKRIADGSGTTIQEVNALLKQFRQLRKMTRKLEKLTRKGEMKWLYQ